MTLDTDQRPPATAARPSLGAPGTHRAPARYAGLDGLRAIAVTLVVVYHLFPQSWVRGGFIGVDVFFVISGFLITTLLLREHAATGKISLLAFWTRRARRLLPALGVVIAVCASAAWFIGGDVLVRLGEQVVGAVTFSYNWVSIAGGTGYFSAATPELFRNFWSLAVEEQFYVLWPLVLPLFLLLPSAWGRAAAAIALATASAAWMGVLVASGGDLTRAYFGTGTHAFGILLGVGLAFVMQSVLARSGAAGPAHRSPPEIVLAAGWKVVLPSSGPPPVPGEARHAQRVRTATGIIGSVSLIALGILALIPPTVTPATFPGVVVGASILTAVAIVAGVWPGSAFGPAIDAQPLRWIGDRSYGIYLWHWPLLVLLVAGTQHTGTEAGFPLWVSGVTLALTLVAAEVSYRVIETPVRRLGFRGSLARLGRRLGGAPAVRMRALIAVLAGVLLLAGTSVAIAAAPGISSGQSAVQAGLDAIQDAANSAAVETAPSGTDADAASSEEPPTAPSTGASAAPAPSAPAADPLPVPSPTPITGAEISAVGDSVMLASAPALLERFPGIQIDAAVSRSTWGGPGILQSLAAGGQLRPYVIVALGTNGPLNADSMEQMAQIVGPDRHLVLVNAYAPRDWIPGVNADLAAFAAARPGVVVADWSGAIAGRTDLLAGDGIHPGGGGARIFADTVAGAVETIENGRAEAQYQAELRAYKRLHYSVVRDAE